MGVEIPPFFQRCGGGPGAPNFRQMPNIRKKSPTLCLIFTLSLPPETQTQGRVFLFLYKRSIHAKKFFIFFKKPIDKRQNLCYNIYVSTNGEPNKKIFEKIFKNLLTNRKKCATIYTTKGESRTREEQPNEKNNL